MIEIIFKVYAFRLKLFQSKMEVFDMMIITFSLLLDAYFVEIETAAFVAEIMIMLRLWRITRVVHGLIVTF